MKLMEALEIVRSPQSQEATPFVASLVCGFNALHFQTFLNAELRCRNVKRRSEISTGTLQRRFLGQSGPASVGLTVMP